LRLFVAIDIPNTIRAEFAAFLKELRAIEPTVKWVRAENLHITLKFLGYTDATRLASLRDALSAVGSAGAISLDFRGLGFFPNEKRPRVFWAGMNASPNLAPLAANIDRAVHVLGFPLEERPLTPHLTLARFNPPRISAPLAAMAKKPNERSFGAFTTREFHLFESKLKPTGAEYTKLNSFLFPPEA
jgi:RNA 2',3'-cyclic 3'-phosphodiesterase